MKSVTIEYISFRESAFFVVVVVVHGAMSKEDDSFDIYSDFPSVSISSFK
jgi:hypothetical protein